MRWPFPLLIGLLPLVSAGQTIYAENFDSLHPGDRISATLPAQWRTWHHLPGSTEDAPVVATFSHSAPHSLRFLQTTFGALGGPVDQMLLLGDRQWGSYVLRWNMYVAEDRGAFMELLHSTDGASSTPAAVFTFNTFSGAGNLQMWLDGQEPTSTFNHGTWFEVAFGFDLDTRVATFWVNGTVRATWAFDTMPSGTPTINQLSAMRFFAYAGGAGYLGEYYIDDLVYEQGTVGIDEAATGPPLRLYPNPTNGDATLSVDRSLAGAEVFFHDASGRLVRSSQWPIGSTTYHLGAGALAPGTYLLRVQEEQGALHTGKLIVLP
ncbi:MAG: T9SS type A sorting domain-containing protein [Flavobacteriales bacterium]|nr:T9SS type A sorting domain-containing protein [Flavobacteriales bacterium]